MPDVKPVRAFVDPTDDCVRNLERSADTAGATDPRLTFRPAGDGAGRDVDREAMYRSTTPRIEG
jgi:hypothetical protein